MVNQTVHATYTETYDLNTAIGELSILGIHTPQALSVKKMFKGFFEQYKKFKILGCNFQMVCASQQALTPDLVGQEAGQVDARDVLNPILFKACTGESMNALLDQAYNHGSATTDSIGSVDQHIDTRTQAINSYYQMLADDTFRKSHPQRGITVTGLRPYVHKVVTTQPFKWIGADGDGAYPQITGTTNTGNDTPKGFGGPSATTTESAYTSSANPTVFVSDGITDMPWLDTCTAQSVNKYANSTTLQTSSGLYTINSIPRVYCGVLVLPPAILQRLFFRLQICWHVLFKDFRPAYEVGPITETNRNLDHDYNGIAASSGSVGELQPTTYFNLYHNATPTKLSNEVSSFSTTEGTEVDTVNEMVR